MTSEGPKLRVWRMDWPPKEAAGRRVYAVIEDEDGEGFEGVRGVLTIDDMAPGVGEPVPVFRIQTSDGQSVPLAAVSRWLYL